MCSKFVVGHVHVCTSRNACLDLIREAARSLHSRLYLDQLQEDTHNFGGLHHQPEMNSPSLRALWSERGEPSVVSTSTSGGEGVPSESGQLKRPTSIISWALDRRLFDRAAGGSTWAGGFVV